MSDLEQPDVGFIINRSYLSDFSFENPYGPIPVEAAEGLSHGLEGGVKVSALNVPDTHRVDVTLSLTAALAGKVVLIAELTYTAEVTLYGIPEQVAPQILCVDVPNSLFPKVREILVNNASYAGYAMMEISPIDFRAKFQAEYGSAVQPNKAA